MEEILAPLYRVHIATSGPLAIKNALSAAPPDLILLDVMMPDMDGYEVCRILKSHEKTQQIPIIFVTAKSGVDEETLVFSLGAADFIRKPASPPVVLARVKTHLAINDQRKLLEDQVEVRTSQLRIQALELDENRLEVIRQLGRAAEYRDNETGMHIQRMSRYTQLLSLRSGMGSSEADTMQYAAMMHDVGKVGIPDCILLKPDKLTVEEFEQMKTHTVMGYGIIGKQKSQLLQLGALGALTHHEKWNGCGYPKGLSGQDIPLIGRLIALADVFDALTSARPYKKAWSVEEALSLIQREIGEHFDPELARLFLELRVFLEEIMEAFRDG
ncbi:MAG: response regulator [Magnetococcales bacterium]|nr:response regulator [Magnetococcales bacterium]